MRFFILILVLIPMFALSNPGAKVNIDHDRSNNKLSIKVNQNEVVRVKIYTNTNQLVWSEERYDTEFKLDFTYFPPDLYNVHIVVNGEVEKYSFRKK